MNRRSFLNLSALFAAVAAGVVKLPEADAYAPIPYGNPDVFYIHGYKVDLFFKGPMPTTSDPFAQLCTAGWKTTINGSQYGDWVTMDDHSPELVAEARRVLIEHARDSIALILDKQSPSSLKTAMSA